MTDPVEPEVNEPQPGARPGETRPGDLDRDPAGEPEPNEIVAQARAHAGARAAAGADARGAQRWPLARIGLAAGIGSAAIAGAVLYAGRGRRK